MLFRSRYLAITPEQIREAVNRYLLTDNHSVMEVIPAHAADAEPMPAEPEPPGEPAQPGAPPPQVPQPPPAEPAPPTEPQQPSPEPAAALQQEQASPTNE